MPVRSPLLRHPSLVPVIPTIDLTALGNSDPAAQHKIATHLAEVYSTVGFAYLSNHGIADDVVQAAFGASRRFHELPMAEKMAIEVNEHHRGYIPINTSTTTTSSVAAVTKPNQSASLMLMHEVPPDSDLARSGAPLAGPNQWPADLPEIKEPLQVYVEAMEQLARQLVTSVELALGVEPNTLLQHFETPTTFLRLLHYPAAQTPPEPGFFGSAPHSDYGFITLLAQDAVGGLQVRASDCQWIDVPYRAGHLVMNTADILHRWSNGRLISTPHRVLASSGVERFSLPFFFDPDVRTRVAPLSSCIEPGSDPMFEPIVYGDYLMHRLQSNHRQHQEARQSPGRPGSGPAKD